MHRFLSRTCLSAIIGLLLLSCNNNDKMDSTTFVLVLHGGAGVITPDKMTKEREEGIKSALNEALDRGSEILTSGGSALDAVEAAVIVMEDSPEFNAGKGSVFTNNEKHELDASIINGIDMAAGSVAGVSSVKNPIRAARKVMDSTIHVMLVGDGANQFAHQMEIEEVDSDYFFNQRRWEQLQRAKQLSGDVSILDEAEKKYGTVGAVAVDLQGNVAAATSTGGMTNKKFGRVGDSPVIGAGTYARNATCAVSCTGEGEFFMRQLAAYDVSAIMDYKGIGVKAASEEVIAKIGQLGGTGGLIAVDAKGNYAMTFNTEGMYRAIIDSEGNRSVEFYK